MSHYYKIINELKDKLDELVVEIADCEYTIADCEEKGDEAGSEFFREELEQLNKEKLELEWDIDDLSDREYMEGKNK